jgi:hypothetical protein
MKDRLGERLSREAQNLRRQAEGMPPGVLRDDLLKKARQADTASQINNWVSSSSQQQPK